MARKSYFKQPGPSLALQVSGPHPPRPTKYHRSLARPIGCGSRAEARPVQDPMAIRYPRFESPLLRFRKLGHFHPPYDPFVH